MDGRHGSEDRGKTAFVFAGGGSLGAVQVGMLRALVDTGLRPDFVVGTSVGAINAARFAGTPDSAGVADLERIWTGLKRNDVFPLGLDSLLALAGWRDNAISPEPLRQLIADNLPFRNLQDAALPLYVMATDQQGVGVCLSSGPAVESILASAAIPGIFPPVPLAGAQLMDGAVAANTPLHLAVELGATRIVVLPTGYACALRTPPRGVIGRVLHAITLLIAWQLMHEIETIPPGIAVHLAPALCPLAVSPYDFSHSAELIERANENTRLWIGEGGLDRQAKARELGAHHHRLADGAAGPKTGRRAADQARA